MTETRGGDVVSRSLTVYKQDNLIAGARCLQPKPQNYTPQRQPMHVGYLASIRSLRAVK